MGINLTASLDGGPQNHSEVSPAPSWLNPAPQSPAPPLLDDDREVLRCLHCQLVQFRTRNNLCRRCRADLDAVPAPAVAAPALTPAPLQPGLETAEASGVPVPNVASAIRACRRRRGLSQRQLAERMRVPRTYVSKIENDKATPTIASLQRVAAAMGTRLTTLLQPAEAGLDPNPLLANPLFEDAFVRALLPFLPNLDPHHLGQLLDASRHLAGAH